MIMNNTKGTRKRRGSLYDEYSPRYYRRGVGICWRIRYVGSIQVNGKRYRCRSTNYRNVRAWLDDMLEKYPTY